MAAVLSVSIAKNGNLETVVIIKNLSHFIF